MLKFFTKYSSNTESSLLEISSHMKPVLTVDNDSDLQKQLDMLQITKKELAIAQALKPYIQEDLEEIVDRFYGNILRNYHLMEIINKHSSIDRLKKNIESTCP